MKFIQWVVMVVCIVVFCWVSADFSGVVNVTIWLVLLVLGVTVFPLWLFRG
jgi:hypothetical protein